MISKYTYVDITKPTFELAISLKGAVGGTWKVAKRGQGAWLTNAMCPPMRAHWHYLANTIELVLPSAHTSPQPKQQIDLFSHFCTAPGRVVVGHARACPSPNNCPSHEGSKCHLIHASLGPPKCTSTKQHLDRFSPLAQITTVSLYFTMGHPFPLPMEDLDPI